ncbi:hypothetical protein V8C37DRAFT_368072 [Trichoderma ceciliae]
MCESDMSESRPSPTRHSGARDARIGSPSCSILHVLRTTYYLTCTTTTTKVHMHLNYLHGVLLLLPLQVCQHQQATVIAPSCNHSQMASYLKSRYDQRIPSSLRHVAASCTPFRNGLPRPEIFALGPIISLVDGIDWVFTGVSLCFHCVFTGFSALIDLVCAAPLPLRCENKYVPAEPPCRLIHPTPKAVGSSDRSESSKNWSLVDSALLTRCPRYAVHVNESTGRV